jgi:hypothetical protein
MAPGNLPEQLETRPGGAKRIRLRLPVALGGGFAVPASSFLPQNQAHFPVPSREAKRAACVLAPSSALSCLRAAELSGCPSWKRSMSAILTAAKLSPKVQLSPYPSDGSVWQSLQNSSITCLEFDAGGVLLAAGSMDGRVAVYDWDECHFRGRNVGTSLVQQRALRVVLTGHAVSAIAWNPENDVEIAVSFLFLAGVHIYNISDESGATCRQLLPVLHRGRHISSAHLSLQFMKDERGRSILAAGGRNSKITVWRSNYESPPAMSVAPSLMCSDVTALSCAGPGLLVTGTSRLEINLYNLNCCKQGSFSATVAPQLVGKWKLQLPVNERLSHKDGVAQQAPTMSGIAYMAPLDTGEEPARILVGLRQGGAAIFDPGHGRMLSVWLPLPDGDEKPAPEPTDLPTDVRMTEERRTFGLKYGSTTCIIRSGLHVASIVPGKDRRPENRVIAFASLAADAHPHCCRVCSIVPGSRDPQDREIACASSSHSARSDWSGVGKLEKLMNVRRIHELSRSMENMSGVCCLVSNPCTGGIAVGLDSGIVHALAPL